jgi:hypothetical protein
VESNARSVEEMEKELALGSLSDEEEEQDGDESVGEDLDPNDEVRG